jgi:Flp pilus assembly protein TadG
MRISRFEAARLQRAKGRPAPWQRAVTSARRGIVAVEMLLALPLVLGLSLAVVEFSLLLTAQQELIAASREGARVASQGGAQTDVVQAAQQVLTGNLSSASITAVLTDSMGQPLASGQPVSVLVSIPANQAVPDLLAFVGFSIAGDTIAGQTVMRKE